MKKISQTIIVIAFIISLTLIEIACSKTSSNTNNELYACDSNISFTNTVKPILDHNCNYAGCHDDQVITALNNYQTVHDGAAQIKLSILTGKMPKNRTIAAADKSAIFCWIDNGAKNN
jgi:hypothetical protein